MSVILYACAVRSRDGLPLSASTDFHQHNQVLECKRKLKALSLTLSQCPARGTAQGRDLCIHFSSAGDVTFLAICTDSVPSAVAFSFLEELQWEFSVSCSSTSVALASRPYAFLGFDRVIQRVKHNFNFARGPPVHLDPSPPPVIVRLEDVEDVNVIVNGYSTLPMQSGGLWKCRKSNGISHRLFCKHITVLPAPVLLFGEEAEDLWPAVFNLRVPRLFIRTAEPVADCLPRFGGVAICAANADQEAP
ncbi:vesicle-trafficking protein SEC22c isoform X2 [Ascaphus truei]|uniref:vesicle-trafficking protein SEC22c isoform X2 n=1 Tax=Ascaphus truei TaxID=8439 RepID=UPI003F59F199